MRAFVYSMVMVGLTCVPCRAEEATTASVAQSMTAAAEKFVASLSPEQAKITVLDFNDPQRLDWTNVPKPTRKGLQYREMSPPQRELCENLLAASLSPAGHAKSQRIRSLENNLREGEKNLTNGHLRDPLRYFLTIFGKPGQDPVWGYSFEGHHLSLNFVVKGDQVFADTPSFWGANPSIVKVFVPGGPKVGVRTLVDEEQLAFDLVNSLNAAQKAKAIIAKQAPNDYRNVGKPQPPHADKEGLSAAEMTPEQQATLRKLLVVYSGHLADPVAKLRMQEIDQAGIGNIYFAWLGATERGIGHSYRIQGPTFVLELVNIQADPEGNLANHIHSVWRSLEHDFGVTAQK